VSRRVLVVGESGQTADDYDAKAIATIIGALRPEWTVLARKNPPLLSKTNDRQRLASSAQRLANLWKQESARVLVHCIYNHEDTDAVEPSHEETADRIELALRAAGCPGHAVACAWELEAWFLMWPEAIEATKKAWTVPNSLRNRQVGKIVDPKRELREKLARGKPPQVQYHEKHAPEIATQIASRIGDRTGSSQSFDRLVETLDACAAR
jgi:hypothetical protein